MITLEKSTDWPVVQTELNKLCRTLPAFRQDFKKFISQLNQQVTQLSNLEVIARRTRSLGSTEQCQQKVSEINENLSKIQQIYLISLMSQNT